MTKSEAIYKAIDAIKGRGVTPGTIVGHRDYEFATISTNLPNPMPSWPSKDPFLKPVIITGHRAMFTNNGKSFCLASPCFDELEGSTVLIDSAFAVYRSDKKIGTAKPDVAL